MKKLVLKYNTAPAADRPYCYRRKNVPSPGCIYNPDGVACDPKHRNCETCGHNPEVAAARTEKIFPGYLTRLQSLPLIERERILLGNWNIPAAEQ